jgi:hypothetical protein
VFVVFVLRYVVCGGCAARQIICGADRAGSVAFCLSSGLFLYSQRAGDAMVKKNKRTRALEKQNKEKNEEMD